MALRLLEIILPEANGEQARKMLEEQAVMGLWQDHVSDTLLLLRVLTSAEMTESVMDALEKRFSGVEKFQLILLPVEACVPRPPSEPNDNPGIDSPDIRNGTSRSALRISREELYAEVRDGAKTTRVFIAMVILSSIVAAIGLMRDNVAVLIGAMVIAPLLGPHVALALATTLGDSELGKNALKTSLIGIGIALILSIAVGTVLPLHPETPEILSRTRVALSDIALALASGAAGSLAFTTGVSAVLIGVMVAVALLPPLVTFGLLIGAEHIGMALGALLLFLINVICVNLAGVGTFLVQGIRPLTGWEADRAKRASRKAIFIWAVLLSVLVCIIIFSQRN